MALEQYRLLAERQGWRCTWCTRRIRRDLRDMQKDHIIPVVRGGPDVDWNWQILHSSCNGQKREIMTEQAIALAAEHGITLLPPMVRPRRQSRYTPEDVDKMAARHAAGETYELIAADFSCSSAWVYELVMRCPRGPALPRSPVPAHAPFIRGDGWKWVS
jgi:hypothetical protein